MVMMRGERKTTATKMIIEWTTTLDSYWIEKNRREKTNTIHIYKLVNIFSKIKKNGRKINLNTCYIYLPQSFLFCFIAPSSKNLIENICVPIINHNRWQTVFFSSLMTDVPRICIRFVHSIYVVLYWYVYGINVCVYIPKFDTVSERKKRILFNLSESQVNKLKENIRFIYFFGMVMKSFSKCLRNDNQTKCNMATKNIWWKLLYNNNNKN